MTSSWNCKKSIVDPQCWNTTKALLIRWIRCTPIFVNHLCDFRTKLYGWREASLWSTPFMPLEYVVTIVGLVRVSWTPPRRVLVTSIFKALEDVPMIYSTPSSNRKIFCPHLHNHEFIVSAKNIWFDGHWMIFQLSRSSAIWSQRSSKKCSPHEQVFRSLSEVKKLSVNKWYPLFIN